MSARPENASSGHGLRRPGLLGGGALVVAVVGWGLARSPGPEVSSSPPAAAEVAPAPRGTGPAAERAAAALSAGRERARPIEADEPIDAAAQFAGEGRSAERRGDRAAALAAFERALALAPDHAGYLREAGRLARALGRPDEAEEYLLRALDSEERSAGIYGQGVAETLGQLGGLYLEQRRYDEAEAAYLRALETEQRAQGRASTGMAAVHARLGLLHQLQGRDEEAAWHLTQALDDQQAASPHGHPSVAARLGDLGDFHRSQGRYAAAEPLLAQALDVLETAHGPDDVRTARARIALARLYRDQERYAEAEPLLEHALALRESAHGSAHPSVIHDLARLSTLHLAQQSYTEAQPYTARAFALDETSPGNGKPRMAAALDHLAHELRSQGQLEQAEALYEWGIDVATRTLGLDSASADYLRARSDRYAAERRDGG